MATYKPTLSVYFSTAATFRAYLTAIRDALVTTCGWTRTADTGQLDLTTVAAPSGYGTSSGYMMFAMGDALQGTYPVYMRLEFGTTNAGGPLYPAVCIQVGSGTDGAGNLTGTVGKKLVYSMSIATNNTAPQHFSGNSSRFVAMIRTNVGVNNGLVFFCERLKNADGTDSNAGVFYGISPTAVSDSIGASTGPGGCQVLEWGQAVPPAWSGQWTGLCIGPGNLYTNVPTTAASGGNVYLFPVIPIGWRAWNPSANLFTYYNADTASNSAFSTTIYGASRSILPIAAEVVISGCSWALANDASTTNNNVYPAIAND